MSDISTVPVSAGHKGHDAPSRGKKSYGAEGIYTPPSTAFFRLCFYFLVVSVLLFGWETRTENYFTSEQGPGYAFGIIGGSMMLALTLYPLRKKARFMRKFGPIRHWFRIHMILGILGPLFILYHANFGLGSLNSNTALICMIIVALSGLVGRYFYTRVHYGLYGPRMTFEKLRDRLQQVRNDIFESNIISEQMFHRQFQLEEQAFSPTRNLIDSITRIIDLGLSTRLAAMRLLSAAKDRLAESPARSRTATYRLIKKNVRLHTYYVRRTAGLTFFERLLSLWHLFHLPLFIMLVISGLIHVLAVHMY